MNSDHEIYKLTEEQQREMLAPVREDVARLDGYLAARSEVTALNREQRRRAAKADRKRVA